MPYGRPSATGHGCRTTRYLWSPSVSLPSRPRKRHHVSLRNDNSRRQRFYAHENSFRGFRGKRHIDWLDATLQFLLDWQHPQWYVSLVGKMVWLVFLLNNLPLFAVSIFVWVLNQTAGDGKSAEIELLSHHDQNRKSIRRHRKISVDEPPKPDDIRKAWRKARRSLGGKLLAGTLLSNLEPVVDQSYIRNANGTIVGRRSGIKGWLAANCPDMLPHYKALMSYKTLSDKLCMALGVKEPETLAGVLDFDASSQTDSSKAMSGKHKDKPKSMANGYVHITMETNREKVIMSILAIKAAITHEKGTASGAACGLAQADFKSWGKGVIQRTPREEARTPCSTTSGIRHGGQTPIEKYPATSGMRHGGQAPCEKYPATSGMRHGGQAPCEKAGTGIGAWCLGTETVETLESALREILGIVGMRRSRRRARAA